MQAAVSALLVFVKEGARGISTAAVVWAGTPAPTSCGSCVCECPACAPSLACGDSAPAGPSWAAISALGLCLALGSFCTGLVAGRVGRPSGLPSVAAPESDTGVGDVARQQVAALRARKAIQA